MARQYFSVIARPNAALEPDAYKAALERYRHLFHIIVALTYWSGLILCALIGVVLIFQVWVVHLYPVLSFIVFLVSVAIMYLTAGIMLQKRHDEATILILLGGITIESALQVIITGAPVHFINVYPGFVIATLMLSISTVVIITLLQHVLLLSCAVAFPYVQRGDVPGILLTSVIVITIYIFLGRSIRKELDRLATTNGQLANANIQLERTKMTIEQQVQERTAELNIANQQLIDYAAQAEELATERERTRIAREIHDSLGHYLTAMSLQLNAARDRLGEMQPDVAAVLVEAQSLVKEALTDVRYSVATLRHPIERRSLSDAITMLAKDNCAAGIQTDVTTLGAPRQLTLQIDDVLYRVVQEALTNVRKHAQATHVQIILDYTEAEVIRLHVVDNGQGAVRTDTGYGLVGMAERIHELGGTLSVQTTPQTGFTVVVEVQG